VYSAPDAPVRVLGEDTAFILSDMLRDVVEGGTAKKLLIKDVPLSAKTGTTGFSQNANRDIWVAAYNPDIAAVAWMGFDRTDSEHCLDAAATGGAHTSILMREVLSRYYNERKAPAFMPGEGVSRVRLDKAALQRGELKLAAPYLLDKDVVTEYLYRDQAAALEGEQNHGQCLIFNFGIELDPMGAPVISFSSSSTIASYLVYRVSEGEGEKIVATLDGKDQMMFADESAAANTGYTYSIQPVDENQTPLGVRSERVYVYVGAR
jgi:membrane peptidoglycan carboxypeptidase